MKRSGPIRRKKRIKPVGRVGLTQKEMHKLWRAVLIAQNGGRCEAAGCGGMRCGGPLQAHHIYKKGTWGRLRYDLENGVVACRNHHLFWIEKAPAMEVGPWLERVCGAPRLLRLQVRAAASKGSKQPKMDLAAVRLYLEQQLTSASGR